MKARRVSWVIMLTLVACSTPDRLHGESADPHAYPGFAPSSVLRQHNYRVDAQVRPFLFWMRKANIGDGRLTWRTGPDATVGYELLVGSDPGRAPRHINRWGYLREESGAGGAMVFGVMSHSDEQSIEEADKNTRRSDRVHVFKALRQVVTGSQARVTVSDIRVSRDLTYADLEPLLASVPAAPSTTKSVPLAEWSSPGFLTAAASLMEEGRRTAGKVSASPRFVRVYPYNGMLYELQLRSADRTDRGTSAERSSGPAIQGRFRVLNRSTRDETLFTIVYGVEGDLAGVPLLISWRPRWWLEIQCVLHDEDRE